MIGISVVELLRPHVKRVWDAAFDAGRRAAIAQTRTFADSPSDRPATESEIPGMAELVAAMLTAGANGEQDVVDTLAAMGPALIQRTGLQAFSQWFAWHADPTERSPTRVTNEHGKHLYKDAAHRAMKAQNREISGESPGDRRAGGDEVSPASKPGESPVEGVKRSKQEQETRRAAARQAFEDAMRSPGEVQPEQLSGLADHLHTLTRDEIRSRLRDLNHAHNKRAGTSGRLKAQLVSDLIEFARNRNSGNPAGAASKADNPPRETQTPQRPPSPPAEPANVADKPPENKPANFAPRGDNGVLDAYRQASGPLKGFLDTAIRNANRSDEDHDDPTHGFSLEGLSESEKTKELPERLVTSWRDAMNHNMPEVAAGLEDAMRHYPNLRKLGQAGERTGFDGAVHEHLPGTGTDHPVTVTRPGWGLEDGEGRTYVINKAHIQKEHNPAATKPPDTPDPTPMPKLEPGTSREMPEDTEDHRAPANPVSGQAYHVPTDELRVDPERFQYKLDTDSDGVTKELKDVRTYNPELGGALSVWRDPQDGKDYVVNGHHRHELASRTGHKNVNVIYIDAKDAQEARAKGALVNIAEGRGTAIDAGKFLRDTKITPDEIAAKGISMRGKTAADGMLLAKLGDEAFHKLARGHVELPHALAVARHVADPARQLRLFDKVREREDAGKETTTRHLEEMARQMAMAHHVTTTHQTLWGDETDDEDTFDERAELAAAIRHDLAQEENDFKVGTSERRADRLGEHGNVINVGTNKDMRNRAARVSDIYHTFAHLKGPVADALNEGAVELKKAKTKKEKDNVRERTNAAVRAAIARQDEEFSLLSVNGRRRKMEADAGAEGTGANRSE